MLSDLNAERPGVHFVKTFVMRVIENDDSLDGDEDASICLMDMRAIIVSVRIEADRAGGAKVNEPTTQGTM